MTAQFLRRFLITLFFATLAPTGIKAEPIEQHESNSSEVAQLTAEWIDIQNTIETALEKLSDEQQRCLMNIHQKYSSKIKLIFLNPEIDVTAFNEFITTNKPLMNKEDALTLQKHIIASLAQENISLKEAQNFFRLITDFEAIQQKMLALQNNKPQNLALQENLDPQEEQPTNKLAEAKELIKEMGPFAKILLMDPEKDAEAIKDILEKLNAKAASKFPLEEVLKVRSATLAELTKRDISPEKISELIAESRNLKIQEMAENLAPFIEILSHNPELEAEYFTQFAKKLSEKVHQTLSADRIISIRKQALDQLDSLEISTKEVQDFLNKEKNEAWNKNAKHIGAAMAASTLFGISDLFIQMQKSIPQAIGSTWNWIMGTIGFYPKHEGISKKSQWTWSKEGAAARVIQTAALLPTGYLFKERVIPQYLGINSMVNDLGGLKIVIEEFKKKHPLVGPLLATAPYIIPAATGQQRETSTVTLQETLGSIKGRAVALGCSRVVPLAAYLAWNWSTFKNIHDAIHKDKHNVWSNTAFAFAPVVQNAISHPFDKMLSKLTPKTGVFWRTFLNNAWGSRLVQIGYGSALRAFLYQQYDEASTTDPVSTFFKGVRVDRGGTERKENIKTNKIEGSTVEYEEVDGKKVIKSITPLETPCGPKKTYIQGHVPHLGETGIGNYEFQQITGQDILVAEEKYSRTHEEIRCDGFNYKRIDNQDGILSEEKTEKQPDGSFKKTNLVDNPYHPSDPRHWLPGANRKTETVYTSTSSKTDSIKTTIKTSSGYQQRKGNEIKKAKSKMDAVKPFFLSSFAKFLAEDVTVAATTSGLCASNNLVARLGRALGRAALRTLIAIKAIKKTSAQDVTETAESAQKLAQMGANVLIGIQGIMSNPLMLINNPKDLERVLGELIESREKMTGNTKLAQMMVHKFFANKMFEHVFKRGIAHQAGKNVKTDSSSTWKYVNYDMSESYNKKQAALAMAGWTALWIMATTLLTETPQTAEKPKDADSFEDSFETSPESLEEAAQGSKELVVA